MELTILTPTYNRANKLKELFNSLQNQTKKNFEWLIVDDGSTDNTRDIVDLFLEESTFPIKYIYKTNGGKHTALNQGISCIESELTFIVDSDDILTADAVETIYQYHRKYALNHTICGYVFLRCYPDGRINGKEFVRDEMVASYIDVRINSDDSYSDKAEIFRTYCLKEFPFPEYKGERFLGEDIVWIRMGRKYQMVFFNKAIYIGDYLESGLTNNRRKLNIQSPVGCMNRAKEFMKPGIKMKFRVKASLQYVVYGHFAGKSDVELIRNTDNIILTIASLFPGRILFNRWKKRYVM